MTNEQASHLRNVARHANTWRDLAITGGFFVTPSSFFIVFLAIHGFTHYGILQLLIISAFMISAIVCLYATVMSFIRWRYWRRYVMALNFYLDCFELGQSIRADMQLDQMSASLAEINRDIERERERFRRLFKVFGFGQ